MARRIYGIGRTHTGERDITILPPMWQGTGPGAVVVHGVGTTPDTYRPPGFRRDLDLLAGPDGLTGSNGAGFAVTVPELGGVNLWPTDTVLDRIGEAVDYLTGTVGVDPGRVVLVGDSAGAAAALIYLVANPTEIQAVAGRLPAVALDAMHDRDPAGLGALMDTAFGDTAAWEAAKTTRDPSAAGPAAAIAGMADRVRLWWSTDDDVVLPGDVAGFVALTGVEAVSVGAVDHAIDGFSEGIALAQAEWLLSRV